MTPFFSQFAWLERNSALTRKGKRFGTFPFISKLFITIHHVIDMGDDGRGGEKWDGRKFVPYGCLFAAFPQLEHDLPIHCCSDHINPMFFVTIFILLRLFHFINFFCFFETFFLHLAQKNSTKTENGRLWELKKFKRN